MQTLTLTRPEIAQMTGRKLIEAIGLIDKYGGWCNNDHVPFVLNGTEWTAYTTRGRGRSSGTTYVHIYRKVQLRVVDPDGNDTGMRVDDYEHMRGKDSDTFAHYKDA